MYAITEKGYRAIRQQSDVAIGETVVAEVPQSLLVTLAAHETGRQASVGDIHTRADTALDSLRAYRDLANPTNVQTVAVVKLLCRVAIVLIRRMVGRLDGAD